MAKQTDIGANKRDLLTYLDIAVKLRNHEFNIQVLRNVIFTGAQAVLLACYVGTLGKYRAGTIAIAGFGVALSLLWWFYYKASLYWAWYWEWRCKQVNDEAVRLLGLGVDVFAGHPSGSDNAKPPSFKFGGRTVSGGYPVHRIIQATQIAFCVLWFFLSLLPMLFWPRTDRQELSIQHSTAAIEQPAQPVSE